MTEKQNEARDAIRYTCEQNIIPWMKYWIRVFVSERVKEQQQNG